MTVHPAGRAAARTLDKGAQPRTRSRHRSQSWGPSPHTWTASKTFQKARAHARCARTIAGCIIITRRKYPLPALLIGSAPVLANAWPGSSACPARAAAAAGGEGRKMARPGALRARAAVVGERARAAQVHVRAGLPRGGLQHRHRRVPLVAVRATRRVPRLALVAAPDPQRRLCLRV